MGPTTRAQAPQDTAARLPAPLLQFSAPPDQQMQHDRETPSQRHTRELAQQAALKKGSNGKECK
jgi:hypothetical protein